jgi:hypothetical protein
MAKDHDKLIADQAKEIASLKKQLAKKQEKESDVLGDIVDYSAELLKIDEQRLGILSDIEKNENVVKSHAIAIKRLSGEHLKDKRKEHGFILNETKSAVKIGKAKLKELETDKKRLKLQEQIAKQQQKIYAIEEKYGDEIEESLGFIDNIKHSIESIPVVGGILSKALGVDDLKERIAKDLTKTFSATLQGATKEGASFKDNLIGGFKGFKQGAKGLVKSLKSINPYAIAAAAAVILIKEALDMDQELTDMARGLGISREEAEHLHHEFLDIAENTKVIGASAGEMSKSYMELANVLGSAKLATAEMAETQVLLTKQYGLAGEDAAMFQRMAMLSGRTAEQNVVAIQGITEEMTGGMMNYKAVMKDVASSSKAVQATFKGNISQLTKAVITARKFGKTLDEVKSITDGLLDIEGSLAAEMEARVLTGKDMNLDKARELALNGKIDESMEEIMKQAGGYDELMKMAPYQREAIAKAANMEVDALIKGAEQQKLLNDLSKESGREIKSISDLKEEDLAKLQATTAEEARKLVLQQQQASAQEKMAELGNKIMAIFGKLAVPMMEILDPLMEIVDFILPALGPLMKFAFAPIQMAFDIIKGIVKIFKGDLLGGLSDIGSGIIKYLLRPFTLALDLVKGFFPGISSWLTGDKSKEAAGDTPKKEHDAQIAPDGGLMVSGKKGTYQLAPDDTVIAGTGLGEASNMANPLAMLGNLFGGNQQSSGDSETVALLKQIAAAMNQPVIVKIGNKVVNEIDKVQTMNRSYVGKVDNSYGAV